MKRQKLPTAQSRHRRPKISFLQAESIRKRVAEGELQVDLAEEFGVHASAICQIVSRKRLGIDVEQERVWLQLNKAELFYEEAQERWRKFKGRRMKEQEEIDRSLLQRVTVKNSDSLLGDSGIWSSLKLSIKPRPPVAALSCLQL